MSFGINSDIHGVGIKHTHNTHQHVIAIVGPTASGKTGLGIALAQGLAQRGEQTEIINADAYQMYRGMDIGTAKASVQERALVPHHLIDIIEPDESMSVAWFQQLARACIRDIQARGVRPMLVGGSGLYARAAIDHLSFPETDPQVRMRLEQRAAQEGIGILYDELSRQDPQAAASIDPRNERRVIRALEVITLTGQPFSAHLPKYQYVMPCVQIGLDIDRSRLDELVDARTQHMRDAGLVDEVRALRNRMGTTARRALGYGEIMQYLDGNCTLDEAFAQIAQHTKRLARKQMGWFGRDSRIHWLDATSDHLVEQALDLVDRADRGEFAEQDAQAEHIRHHLGSI